jgi:Tol biopolymer transport system component/predicted Ser/Thr protein kinase
MIGETISNYRVVEKLGEGGMGVVYKAEDMKLDRPVALKFLPPHLAASEQDKVRFIQEAKAASAINHPNICTIHDIQENEDQLFIVMEYVEGQTLTEKKQNLSQKLAIEIGTQIADGLAAAHEKGIVHRDIKPENIMVRKDGIVQIMDFGLAKLAGVSRLTKEGSTVGTAGYMSPEQVQGQEVDHRTDIFSLGVLLYEMFGGELPFKGVHETAMAYEIVNVDAPPLSSLRQEIDPQLDAIVLECLAKEPDERYQSAKEVSKELRRFKRESSRQLVSRISQAHQPVRSATMVAAARDEPVAESSGGAKGNGALTKRGNYLWMGLAGALLLALIGLGIAYVSAPSVEKKTFRAALLAPAGSYYNTEVGGHVAISPDGNTLAFVAVDSTGIQRLWVRPLEHLVATPLAGTDGAYYPFWSPDSRSIGFFAEGKMRRINAAGGPPLTICDAGSGRGGAWNDDNVILFAPTNADGIYRVPAGGGDPEPVTQLDSLRNEQNHRWPHFLPGGKDFLYVSQTRRRGVGTQDAVHVSTLEGGESRLLFHAASNVAYAEGYLLYVRESSLVAQPFDPGSFELTGDAYPVAEQVQYSQARSKGIFSVSASDVFVYQSGEAGAAQMVWLDREGKQLSAIAEFKPTYFAVLSPDGRRVAYDDYDSESRNYDVWLYDLDRDVNTRFTFDPGLDVVPSWSPDGNRITFSSDRNGQVEVFEKHYSGAEDERLFVSVDREAYVTSFSPDGRFAALSVREGTAGTWDLWILDLEGDRTPIRFVEGEFSEWIGAFSPDGRWVAYQSNESGRYEIYVRSFPEGEGKWQISRGGGTGPVWRKDGKEILFDSENGKLMAVDIETDGPSLQVGMGRVLFDLDSRVQLAVYDISPDGSRFLASVSTSERSVNPVTLVVNWESQLQGQ